MRYLIPLLVVTCFFVYWYWPAQKHSINQRESILALGKNFFFDPQLSATGTKSCASCHNPQYAFTDGYRKTLGIFADVHSRNTPGLVNVAANAYFNWANPSVTSLEQQMQQPLFSHHITEMGLEENDPRILTKLTQQQAYKELLAAA